MGASDLWNNFGYYGAKGITGAEALAYEINRVVHASGISSPVTTKRGLSARLRYLDSAAGRDAMREQGITDRALKSWMSGKVSPSRASREKLDIAYWTRRRENLIRSGQLKKLLDNGGAGRRVEIFPIDQSQVTKGRARRITERSISVRYLWNDMVDAWAAKDLQALDEVWDDIICDLDSDYAAYAYVSAVSIGV
ncbi:hypothetical protein QZH56_36825 [Streptomyces olivoreticuli]|uniref:hypothetical protein n=1 Tax=Streptomyces olivoreticuli TaxID=68246 RepID=UPI00265940E1|nr:hypothetical protein [Streptomyces olivoreticuli]WKK24143.1 hypothetical protein QZH56_36825 [Streptomyces olivoreticuli]